MTHPNAGQSSTISVLVLEDDASILEVTQLILEEAGFVVIPVTDGREIKKKLAERLPHVILMDVWAPGHDVRKITHYLKSEASTKHIPVILFSATSNIDTIVAEAGADDFIPKPFDIDELINIIRKYAPAHPSPAA